VAKQVSEARKHTQEQYEERFEAMEEYVEKLKIDTNQSLQEMKDSSMQVHVRREATAMAVETFSKEHRGLQGKLTKLETKVSDLVVASVEQLDGDRGARKDKHSAGGQARRFASRSPPPRTPPVKTHHAKIESGGDSGDESSTDANVDDDEAGGKISQLLPLVTREKNYALKCFPPEDYCVTTCELYAIYSSSSSKCF